MKFLIYSTLVFGYSAVLIVAAETIAARWARHERPSKPSAARQGARART